MSAGVFWSADVEVHQGRRPNQEDYAKCRDDCHLMVLADGMGGHSDGEKASRIVVEKFSECFQRYFKSIEAHGWDADYVRGILEESVGYASHALDEAKQRGINPVGSDAGCTLLAACINPRSHEVQFLSVGDSIILVKHRDRQWVWENGKYLDTHLRVLRLDAERLKVKFGPNSNEYRRAVERTRTDPKRHGLTQAITGTRRFVPHIWTSEYPFIEGDRFILASDGILPLLGGKEEKPNYDKLDFILCRGEYCVPHVRLSQNDRCSVTRRSAARIISAVIAEGEPNQDNVSVLLVDFPSIDGIMSLPPSPRESADGIRIDDDVDTQPVDGSSRHTLGPLLLAFLLVSLGAIVGGGAAFEILSSKESTSREPKQVPQQPQTSVQQQTINPSGGAKVPQPSHAEDGKSDDPDRKRGASNTKDVGETNPNQENNDKENGGGREGKSGAPVGTQTGKKGQSVDESQAPSSPERERGGEQKNRDEQNIQPPDGSSAMGREPAAGDANLANATAHQGGQGNNTGVNEETNADLETYIKKIGEKSPDSVGREKPLDSIGGEIAEILNKWRVQSTPPAEKQTAVERIIEKILHAAKIPDKDIQGVAQKLIANFPPEDNDEGRLEMILSKINKHK